MNNGIFDTHCHLMSDFYANEETSEIIKDAQCSNVTLFNNVGYDLLTSEAAVRHAVQYESVYATIGIHPTEVNNHLIKDLDRIEELANEQNVVAIGEIGLDYYHKNVEPAIQQKWFRKLLTLAKKNNLPVVIHCRDAYEDCYKILVEEKINRGVMHCYVGDLIMAKKFLDLGFYLSFAGNITFKNAENIRNVAKNTPLNRILLETDAPFLAPDPYRSKINFPKYINYTAKKIAEIKKMPLEQIIRITNQNGRTLFNIK